MSRLIILEGARGTGKSTISFNLRQQLKHSTLINFTGFHDDGEKGLGKISSYYHDWFTLFKNLKAHVDNYTIICDRFFPSEMVFSDLYKNYNFTDTYKMLSKLLPTLADEVILLNFIINDKEELRNRLLRDKIPFANVAENVGETLIQQEKYKEAIELLKKEVEWDRWEKVKFYEVDTSNREVVDIQEEVLRLINEQNNQ